MCNITLNSEKNGIELSFENKPSRETLDAIKAHGFRWHRTNKIWYAKQTPERIEFANTLGELTETVKTPGVINLDDLGANHPGYHTTDLAKAIREDLKRRGVKGCTVRGGTATYTTTIRVTVKATSADFVSIEEGKLRNPEYKMFWGTNARNGIYNGERWVYEDEFNSMTDDQKSELHTKSIIYSINRMDQFSERGDYDRDYYWEVSTDFFNKLCAIWSIANQWNYDRSDSMTDYFDIGYFLDIDIKRDKDFEIRETMTPDEKAAYADEVAEKERRRAADIERMERERIEAEERAKARAEKWERDYKYMTENMEVTDIDPIYVTNLVGGIGKECSLEELKETIVDQPSSKLSDALVTRKVAFKTPEAYEIFANNLLADFDFLDDKGGMATRDTRCFGLPYNKMNDSQRESVKFYMNDCVGFYLDGKLMLVSDPEGYSYSRYTYMVTEETEILNGEEELKRQEELSKTLPPFYFPDPVVDQVKKLRPGMQITVYKCDGWILNSIYDSYGTILDISEGEWAQYKGVYITYANGKRTFIRDNNSCLIYEGIKPLLPEEVTSEKVSENMYEVFNYDVLFPRVLDYYKQMGEEPIIDTIQR